MKRAFFLFAILSFTCNLVAQSPPTKWYRGNTHTHTKNSDGDSLPQDVTRWYATHGYDFVVITDHEHVTAVEPLNAEFGKDGKFLVISGQEVTDRFDTKPCHVNGLGHTQVVMPKRATAARRTIFNRMSTPYARPAGSRRSIIRISDGRSLPTICSRSRTRRSSRSTADIRE